MYTAACLSNGDFKSGFQSVEDAENFVKTRVCKSCLEDLQRGFIDYGSGKVEITSIMSTSCGAEWVVITDEEFDITGCPSEILDMMREKAKV